MQCLLEEQSNSSSQEVNKIFVSKGDCTKIERTDLMEGSSGSPSCIAAKERTHDPKADAGLIPEVNVKLTNESIADENHNEISLKTERLSPKYQKDDRLVHNGLMMPTLLSTAPKDTEDDPPQPVTTVKSIPEQKLDTPKETDDNANERPKAVHGGAVWDIFRREDVPKLIQYLERHWHEFRHFNDQPVESVDHPIHDQTMFLSESQKKQLKEEFDIEPWTFEQHLGEAVFIPAGLSSPSEEQAVKQPSCIKVALDFVAPESVEECLRLTQEFRRLPKDHRSRKDKLELKKIAMYAASSAIREAKDIMQKSVMQ